MPVGGGVINDTLLLKIVRLSSVKNPKILVITYATNINNVSKAAAGRTAMLKRIGFANISLLDINDQKNQLI